MAQECCGLRQRILLGQRPTGGEELPHSRRQSGNQILGLFLDLPEARLDHSSGKFSQTVLKINTPPFILINELLMDPGPRG